LKDTDNYPLHAYMSSDVSEELIRKYGIINLPILHVCTAERVAYRNLVNRTRPPRSASYRNVYREWIGAQIRADFSTRTATAPRSVRSSG